MIRTAWPDEPRIGDVVELDTFPGIGADPTEPIDWYALNAYAELAGWRCRFLPHFEGFGADIVYPGDDTFELAASLSYAVDPRPRDAIGRLRA